MMVEHEHEWAEIREKGDTDTPVTKVNWSS